MNSDLPSINKANWPKICTFISALLALSLILLVFLNLNKGYNLSDESMYLYSISYPERLLNVFSDFGALLNPIFMALGADLYNFRVFTFLSLMLCSGVLLLSFVLLFWRHVKLNVWTATAICSALWCSSLGYYTTWLPTASYNTLALLGILGVLSSINFYTILCRPYSKGHFLTAWSKKLRLIVLIFLAFFGLLAFIGKPSSGAALGILACAVICCTRGTLCVRERVCDVIFAGVLALIMLAIYVFLISSGFETIDKIIISTKLLDNTYGFDKTLALYGRYFFPTSYVLVLLTWPLWAVALWAMHKEKYKLAIIVTSLTMLVALITSYIWIINFIIPLVFWPFIVMLFIGACLWKRSWKHLRFSIFLFLTYFTAIFIYHAGTNTSLEFKASESFILIAFSSVSLCMGMVQKRRDVVLQALAIILCFSTLGTLFYSIFETARHNDKAMWQLTEPVQLKPDGNNIYVHPERKLFIEWLRKTAHDNGWQAGMPIINTSFYTTGSLFLLDGYKVEGAWQIESRHTPKENYPIIMSLASKEILHKAWIIKPVNDGPRHMPTQVLKDAGLSFPEGYELLGTSPAESTQGVWPAEQYEIWKPKN